MTAEYACGEAGALFVGGMIWIKPERSLFAYNEVQGPKTNLWQYGGRMLPLEIVTQMPR